uniref:LOW QUALITY PROTEIN: C-C chemokine receptor type 5-like n=1 Tax=Gasterosteus aculeatus aculeatus TaxID=481459 RepID=UPI001A981169|nr:LOW QUALITY PROTEIN: C-C chemokine receptor type 5-like [Gasterosteus aculeatus aculeatus]
MDPVTDLRIFGRRDPHCDIEIPPSTSVHLHPATPDTSGYSYQRVCRMEELNSSVVPSNISSSDGQPLLTTWVSTSLIPALVLSLCFLLGVPGNIAVIVLRPNWQHLSSLSQSLVMNLAVSDLLCLLTLPLWIYTLLYSETFGLVTCKLVTYLVHCSVYGSLLTVSGEAAEMLQSGRLTAMIPSVPSLVFRPLEHQQVAVRLTESAGFEESLLFPLS